MTEELDGEEEFILLQLQKHMSLFEVVMLLEQGLKPSEIQPLCDAFLNATVH